MGNRTDPRLRIVAVAVVTVMLAAGCAAGEGAAPAPATPEATPAPETTFPTPPEEDGMPGRAVPDRVLRSVTADAADRAGVDPSAVRVVRAEPKVWPDGALGCPEPGKVYTQAIVEGWQIILAGPDRQYDYRIGQRGTFKLCERPGAASGAVGDVTPRPFPSRPGDDA